MNTMRRYFCLIALLSLVLSSCASTRLTTVWKDEVYLGWPQKKLVIIGAFSDAGVRGRFEDEFVRQLSEQGTEAVNSNAVLPFDNVPKQEAVVAYLRDQRADAFIITRFLGRNMPVTGVSRKRPDLPREFAEMWQDFYLHGSAEMPGFAAEREVYFLETVLYEAGTDRPIWKVVSETAVQGQIVLQYKELVSRLVDKLRNDKMIIRLQGSKRG